MELVRDYQYLINDFGRGCFFYLEGDEYEGFWVDEQSCMFMEICREDEETGLIDGKKYWMISPLKPKGTTITPENQGIIRWAVEWATDKDDVDKEWDFNTHSPKDVKFVFETENNN